MQELRELIAEMRGEKFERSVPLPRNRPGVIARSVLSGAAFSAAESKDRDEAISHVDRKSTERAKIRVII